MDEFVDMSKEELLEYLACPECIELGCEPWEEEGERRRIVKEIKQILVEKHDMKMEEL